MRQGRSKLERPGLIIAGLLLLVALVGGASYLLWPRGDNQRVDHPQSLASQEKGTSPSESIPQVAVSQPGGLSSQSYLPAALPSSAKPLRVPILMYHYIDATPPPAGPYAAGLTVLTAQFEAQMDYLASNGYHTVTLEQIYAAMAGLSPLPANPVALTFDDGAWTTTPWPIPSFARIISWPPSS